MFGTLGGPELFLIFVVALIVFGPRKLPEIGKSLGKMMSEFRRASNDFRSTIESEVEAEKIRESMRIEPPRVAPAKAATAPPPSSGQSAPASTPAGESTSPPTGEEAPSATTAGSPGPDADSKAAAGTEHEPVPETVSREPVPQPTEQK